MKRAAILLAVVSLAGCGDERKQIRATLTAYDEAFARGDHAAVCALETEAAQRETLRFAQPGTETCAGASAPRRPDGFGVSEAEIVLVEDAGPLRDIVVDGDRAVARYAGGAVTTLRKVDGKWLIDR